MPDGFLLREVTRVERVGTDVLCTVRAVRCVELEDTPGYLTGETLLEQGAETTMPNLPRHLPLPPLDTRTFVLRLSWAAPRTARLTIAPEGARVLTEDGSWLGMVVERPDPPPVEVTVTERDDAVVVASAELRITVQRRTFALRAEDVATGAVLLRTAERLRQVAGFPMAPAVLVDDAGTTLHLELGSDEHITGLGEQFGPLVKNGQRLVLRVEDALGTGTGLAYKPVPVWHSDRGWCGFLNTGAVVTADVGHRRPSVLALTVADEAVDLYLIAGHDPRGRSSSYTTLTGRPPVPPLWAFGYWMGRCRYSSREQVLQVAAGMRAHSVPCDVLHLDPDWLVVDRLNTDFIWNTDRFGERRAFVQALEEQGLRLSVWELPYLDPASPRYDEARDKHYLVETPAGEVASVVRTPSPDGRPRALVDFTNADAKAWWQGMHEEFVEDGVAVFKTDFGEGLPDDVVTKDGTPPAHAHNLYPLRYNAAVSEAVGRYSGRTPLVWGRSGWAGSQRYPGQWGGDAESTVAGMLATVRGGLSYALSAPGFWSHDIGGFFGPELTPALYVRWTQLGALSPLMRAHGLRPREPWEFGGRALEISRAWVRLRYSLLPYLWQVAQEASTQGWPLLRPLSFEFPDDPGATSVDDCFLLGPDLLVVPVFDDGEQPVVRRFYVPEGGWTDHLTGERSTGPGYRSTEVPLERMPLLVRDGAVLPTLPVADDARRTDDVATAPWVLQAYGPDRDVERLLVGFDGTPTTVRLPAGSTAVEVIGTQQVAGQAVRRGA